MARDALGPATAGMPELDWLRWGGCTSAAATCCGIWTAGIPDVDWCGAGICTAGIWTAGIPEVDCR